MQVDHFAVYALFRQHLRRFQHVAQQRPVGEDHDVLPLPQSHGFADFEIVVFPVDHGDREPASHPDVGRIGRILQGDQGFHQLHPVRRGNHPHIRNVPGVGNILQGHVGRAEVAVAHAPGFADQLDPQSHIAQVHADLVQRPAGQERGVSHGVDVEALVLQARAGADQVLLRDAHVHDVLRIRPQQVVIGIVAAGVRRGEQHLPVLFDDVLHRGT